jgi:hypothetical protein
VSHDELTAVLGMRCAAVSIMGRDPVRFVSVPRLRPDLAPLRKAAVPDPLGASRLRGRPVGGGPTVDSGRYGSFVLSGDETALRYRYDEAEMMVQNQSLAPADLRDIGRDGHRGLRWSSAPALTRSSSSNNDRRGAMRGSRRSLRRWICATSRCGGGGNKGVCNRNGTCDCNAANSTGFWIGATCNATWEPTATCSALPLRRGGDGGAGPVPRPRGPPRHGARRAITARDGPRHPPGRDGTAAAARRDARERAQPTKLDLFRSCSDVEEATVDLEASRRGWTSML